MLFLLFKLGNDRYALDVRQVAEVMPLVAVKRIPLAPAAVRGTINHRGSSVPLVDLSQLALGQPAPARLSTRIVLVHYPDHEGRLRLLGLLAEHVTETVKYEPGDFQAPGVVAPDAPYLGPVVADPRGLVQWVQPERLLPAGLRELLFGATAEA